MKLVVPKSFPLQVHRFLSSRTLHNLLSGLMLTGHAPSCHDTLSSLGGEHQIKSRQAFKHATEKDKTRHARLIMEMSSDISGLGSFCGVYVEKWS